MSLFSGSQVPLSLYTNSLVGSQGPHHLPSSIVSVPKSLSPCLLTPRIHVHTSHILCQTYGCSFCHLYLGYLSGCLSLQQETHFSFWMTSFLMGISNTTQIGRDGGLSARPHSRGMWVDGQAGVCFSFPWQPPIILQTSASNWLPQGSLPWAPWLGWVLHLCAPSAPLRTWSLDTIFFYSLHPPPPHIYHSKVEIVFLFQECTPESAQCLACGRFTIHLWVKFCFLKFICWSPNLQYLRMWPYLEIGLLQM